MTLLPPSSSDHEQPEPSWLDSEHVLEPLEGPDPGEIPSNDPIVLDVTGRMWRVRYRPAWAQMLTRAAPVLVGLVLLALLFVLRV